MDFAIIKEMYTVLQLTQTHQESLDKLMLPWVRVFVPKKSCLLEDVLQTLPGNIHKPTYIHEE